MYLCCVPLICTNSIGFIPHPPVPRNRSRADKYLSARFLNADHRIIVSIAILSRSKWKKKTKKNTSPASEVLNRIIPVKIMCSERIRYTLYDVINDKIAFRGLYSENDIILLPIIHIYRYIYNYKCIFHVFVFKNTVKPRCVDTMFQQLSCTWSRTFSVCLDKNI